MSGRAKLRAVLPWLIAAGGCVEPPAIELEPSRPPTVAPASEAELVHAHPDADGPGWRVRDNVFESVHEPLRVRPLPGWRLVLEGEIDPEPVRSGFALVHPRQQIELYVKRLTPMVADVEERRRERAAVWMAEAGNPAPTMVAQLGGESITFTAGTGASEIIHAFPLVHGQPIEIVGRYPASSNRELLREHIRAALAAIEVLEPSECAALRVELERSPSARDQLGQDWSLRGDTFRDFEFGVRVRIPSPVVRVLVGAEAEEAGNGVRLMILDPGRQARALFMAYQTESPFDPEAWHEHALGYTDGLDIDHKGAVVRRQHGDAVALVSMVEDSRAHWRVQLATVVHGDHAAIMIVEGLVDDEHDVEALATFEVADDLERSRIVGDRYFDLHAGYAIAELLETKAINRSGESTGYFFSHTQWTHGSEQVFVTAHNFAAIAGPMSKNLRTRMEVLEVQATGREVPEWVDLSAPHRGQALAWIDDRLLHTAALFVHGRTIYELQVRSRDERLFERALAGLQLLD